MLLNDIKNLRLAITEEFTTIKDTERADNLNWKGRTFEPMAGSITKSNAKKMALSITDKNKILGRLQAVNTRWGNQVSLPFVKKVLILWPNSIYTKAYYTGESDGNGMSPSRPYSGNIIEKIMYNTGFALKRGNIIDLS